MNKITTIPTRHSVNLGDLIYSLWGLQAVSMRHNSKIELYQWLDKEAYYYEGAAHPTQNEGKHVTMNKKMFDMVKPLMLALPFIHSFEIYDHQKIALNLDRCRTTNVNIPYGDIRKWIMYADPELQADISKPVFTVKDLLPHLKHDIATKLDMVCNAIICNRTSRYRNLNISYGELQRQPLKVYFVGTMEEYADFQDHVPKAIYLRVENFLELAILIGSCKLFVGNQSFCFALSEAMKTPRILELCSYAPNVIVCGENGYDYYEQFALDHLIYQLIA